MYCQDMKFEILHLGPLNLSFIWRVILLCPLYRVSIKRGSTVILWSIYCNNVSNRQYNAISCNINDMF